MNNAARAAKMAVILEEIAERLIALDDDVIALARQPGTSVVKSSTLNRLLLAAEEATRTGPDHHGFEEHEALRRAIREFHAAHPKAGNLPISGGRTPAQFLGIDPPTNASAWAEFMRRGPGQVIVPGPGTKVEVLTAKDIRRAARDLGWVPLSERKPTSCPCGLGKDNLFHQPNEHGHAEYGADTCRGHVFGTATHRDGADVLYLGGTPFPRATKPVDPDANRRGNAPLASRPGWNRWMVRLDPPRAGLLTYWAPTGYRRGDRVVVPYGYNDAPKLGTLERPAHQDDRAKLGTMVLKDVIGKVVPA